MASLNSEQDQPVESNGVSAEDSPYNYEDIPPFNGLREWKLGDWSFQAPVFIDMVADKFRSKVMALLTLCFFIVICFGFFDHKLELISFLRDGGGRLVLIYQLLCVPIFLAANCSWNSRGYLVAG